MPSKKPSPKLPAALAARATAAASSKRDRLHREARDLLTLIARRKKEITEAFYDIGEALTRLKSRDLLSALGRRTFAELCEKDAKISVATAERLVAIVASLTRVQALAMGQKKAMAMVTLAAATPDPSDSAAGLFRKKAIALPGGRSVSPRTASANELEEAATAIRHRASSSAPAAKKQRGRTTSADERALATLLQRRLRQLGLERATVTAVATKPGQGSDLRFEHIPAANVSALAKAVGH